MESICRKERLSVNHPIDFVLPWVDGNDPAWRAEKQRATAADASGDGRDIRFRDWDLLRYWFRGIETFAPWVNKIHFITWGHLPSWLNTGHAKLHIVRHEDYIPKEYLPTFSANTIEMNLHRLEGLSEHFVYFNDDMFLLRAMQPEAFFQNGLPCDTAAMNPADTLQLSRAGSDDRVNHFAFNDMQYLNRRYTLRSTVKSHPGKWLNYRYGTYAIRNLLLLMWPRFCGFVDFHLPQAYLKSSFAAAWADEENILRHTCLSPLRSDQDVNQWYVRYRQLAENRFVPVKPITDASFCIDGSDALHKVIRTAAKPMICLNDSPLITNELYETEKERLQKSFETILNQKSEFEK